VAGGVFAQVLEGADAWCRGPLSRCREGGRGVVEQAGDEAGGVADGGVVDAEEGGGDVGGDAEVALEERGQEVVGGVEAAGLPGVGPGAGAAAADAEVVLEAGVEAGGEGGGQGGDGGGVRAGEGGVVQVVLAAGPGWRRLQRFRLRGGAGDGEEGVVPVAVELVAG
jgi:hypothetical protein